MGANVVDIKPQEGFQTKVALSKADINIIGGAAGCGKSFIMLYMPLMYRDDPNLRVTYFRRTQKQIRENGAIWDESTKIYPLFNFDPAESILKWRLPKGGIIDFSGIEYEKDLVNFQGAAIPYMLFDELTHFSRKQFFFMISRNRGTLTPDIKGCLQKPQVFASCNPDPDSWVAEFVEWYIDQDTGYPIPEREGVLRYFIVIKDKVIWGNTKKEVYEANKEHFQDESFIKSGLHPSTLIKSFTFIGGKIYDNKKLLSTQPGYLASLMSQSDADQERFLKGNWKIRSDDSGLYENFAIEAMFKSVEHEDTKFVIGWQKDKEIIGIDRDYNNNFITCDAAKFGRDLCVIFVWKKFVVVHITIFYLSSPQEIKDEIELLRRDFHVPRQNTCVDQDGVGGDVVKLGGYYGFMARREVAVDETMKVKENYNQRKDQCYFRSAARVNSGGVSVILLSSTVKVYDKGAKHPRWSTNLKWGGSMMRVRTLIEKQLRAIKRGDVEFEGSINKYEGGNLKLRTNTKEEQKAILGHSPDFADNFMMREDLDLRPKRKGGFNSY